MKTHLACVLCGEDRLHLDETENSMQLDGVETKVPFRTHWCEACGTRQTLAEDLRFNARAIRRVGKRSADLLTGEEVRAVRKQLGLSQDQAARLFGGGPVAFSKYENDEVTQSDSMDRLLRLVAEHPWLMSSLARRSKLDLAHIKVSPRSNDVARNELRR